MLEPSSAGTAFARADRTFCRLRTCASQAVRQAGRSMKER
ncbi:hypothetical protein I603_0432 [Erythrobacter dokdonensis DSW-74]|uniref:Uncharacterized protein n=1 Tax=Erythrobacter dokdonensis DSW-74 TaxID=1300349 RepID=A0A1A7BKQ2_9SPHN|nr:hypothetical protein I603_0432 [Erythrobacter dokdonensis DSW-74]